MPPLAYTTIRSLSTGIMQEYKVSHYRPYADADRIEGRRFLREEMYECAGLSCSVLGVKGGLGCLRNWRRRGQPVPALDIPVCSGKEQIGGESKRFTIWVEGFSSTTLDWET